jgi:hypothetical protein
MIGSLEKPYAHMVGERANAEFEEGILIYDVASDPRHPTLLSHFRTGGTGTHRNFYGGGDFAYLCAQLKGFLGQCLLVVDVRDPAKPQEVGRWWWPGQNTAAGEIPHDEDTHYMHGPAYVVGNRAYVSYGRVGAVILDVSNPAKPQLVSRVSVGDIGNTLGCHSAVPIPGRNLLVINSEAIQEGREEGLNYSLVVDIRDESQPKIIAALPMPQPAAEAPYSSYHDRGGRFGPHNQAHHQGMSVFRELHNHVVMTYFNAGLRIFNIIDPYCPVEVGYYVSTDPVERIGILPKTLVSQAEDVAVDSRGYIYCTDKNWGLSVLQYEGNLD